MTLRRTLFATFFTFVLGSVASTKQDTVPSMDALTIDATKARYEATVSTMLDTLRRAHTKDTNSMTTSGRSRRASRTSKLVYDTRGLYRIVEAEPVFSLCSHSKHVSITTWRETYYALCISSQGFATLGQLSVFGWLPLERWNIGRSRQSVLFQANDILYAVIADSMRGDGTDLLRLNPEVSEIKVDHTIHSRYATAVALWKMSSEENSYHLAIANSQGPTSDVFLDYTYMYDWRGSYFDQYDSVQSHDVRDLEAFSIYGQAYLAVANRKTAKGVYEADSEIFRFDLGDWRWKSFQKIRTHAVSDIHFFEMGPERAKEFYLVVANQFQLVNRQRNFAINSVIYKFVGNRFVPFQCLTTHGATSISAHTDPDTGAFLLVLANLFSPVQIFQYDGWNFVSSATQFSQEAMAPGATALTFHPWNGFQSYEKQLALVVSNPSKDQELSVFSLTFVREYPFRKWYRGGLEWCNEGHRRLNDTKTPELVEVLAKTHYVDQTDPITLQGPVSFQGGLDVGGTLRTPKVMDTRAGTVLDHNMLFQLESLNRRLFDVKNRINNLKSALNVALRTSGTQTVSGLLEFDSLSSSCKSTSGGDCEIQSIEASVLNGQNVEALASNVIFLDQPNKLIGNLDFEELHVEGNIFVSGLVDGINTSHVVTRESKNKIYSQKIFDHTVVTNNINVQGTLDGIKVNAESIMLTEGAQQIFGELTVQELQVQDIEVEGLVSGVNLHEFYNDVVLLDGGVQVVTGHKTLKGPLTFSNLHLESGQVNGVNLVDLWTNAVWLDSDQDIHAPWNFTHLSLVNPQVSSVNGIQIPGPEIVTSGNGDIVVPVHQRFLGPVIVDRLEVLDSLNGLTKVQGESRGCPDQLDILLKSCEQTITGSKTFVSLALGGKNQITGNLNNFNMTDLVHRIKHRTYNLSGDWIFNQVDIRAPVLVREDLVGWKIEEMYNRALKLHQPLPENALITFKNLVEIERLTCPDINGVNVERDLLLRRSNAVITATKHWQHLLLLDNAQVVGGVNGYNINFLKDTLLNVPQQQVLREHRIIEGDLIVNDIDLRGLLSGLDIRRAIPLNADITLHSSVHLDNVTVVGEMLASSITVNSGRVNGHNLVQVLNDTMIYSSPQRILGHKRIMGDLVIPEGADLKADFVNGISMGTLAANTVYSNVPQRIFGKKTFSSPTRFKNLLMNGSINGISVWEIFNDWMLQDVPQRVDADVAFTDGLDIDGDVIVTGLVNGINIRDLEQDIVKTRQPMRISGNLHLETAEVVGDIAVTGRIQGVDISEDAALMLADNVIAGKKQFRNMLIDGDLLVDGQINDVNVGDMCQFTARRSGDLNLDEVVVRGNLKVDGDFGTSGRINELDLGHLKNSVYMLNDSIHFDNVMFNDAVFEQPVQLQGSLNGANLDQLNSKYMSLTKDQDITGRVTFNAPVTYEGLVHVLSMNTPGGIIGQINVTHLGLNVLTSYGDQTVISKYVVQGDIHFMESLEISSLISEVSFPDGVAMKSRTNVVSGPLIFVNDLTVTSELHILEGATVQEVDISEWASQTVMTTGQFTLTGTKTFTELHLLDVKAMSLIGGTNISESSVLLKKGSQVAKGQITFVGSVQVDGSLDTVSEINGVDVTMFLREAVIRSRPSVITGRKVFIAPLTVSRLTTTGFVAGVNVTELSHLVMRPYDLQALHSELTTGDTSINLFNSYLEATPILLGNYEEEFRWLDEQSSVQSWDYLETEGTPGLLFISWAQSVQGCSEILSYVISEQGPIQSANLPSSMAIKVQAFTVETTIHLATANVHDHCNSDAGGVQVLTLNGSGALTGKQQLTSESSSDVSVLLATPALPCVASAVPEKILVHCFNSESRTFELAQNIPLAGVLKLSFASCNEGTFLTASVFQDGAWSVHVFAWNGQEMVQIQRLPAIHPVAGSIVIGSEDRSGQPLCLLVVPEASSDRIPSPTIIYSFDPVTNYFVEYQRLTVRDVLDVHWSKLPSDLSITLLTSNGVYTLLWKGHEGFVPHDFLQFHGARSVLTFGGHGSHYVAISGKDCDAPWWEMQKVNTRIFKARIRGL